MTGTSSFALVMMGAFFGLSAGISPGPLLTLVISETLQHSKREGIKVALAPLITDFPIIVATAIVFSRLSEYQTVIGIISILGGLYFSWLGVETMRAGDLRTEPEVYKSDSLKKGIIANFLNPNPYIFWLTAGIPTAWKAYESSLPTAILWFLMFYVMLVGSKMAIAVLAERSKSFLKNNTYRVILKILAILLFVFAALFIYNGLKGILIMN